MRRALRLPTVLLAAALLASCIYAPRPVEGLPSDDAWLVLPLRSWYPQERGEPEGVAACLSQRCPNRLMVSVVRLRGEAAAEARRVLADPGLLAAFVEARDRADENVRRRAIETRVAARPLSIGGMSGFAATLVGEGPGGRTAHGAALAREEGRDLRVALVVGDDAEAVEAALRQIAAEALAAR